MKTKRQDYAMMRELGYSIKRKKNPLWGKTETAEKYVRYWMDGGTIVCYVGEEGQYLCAKQPQQM